MVHMDLKQKQNGMARRTARSALNFNCFQDVFKSFQDIFKCFDSSCQQRANSFATESEKKSLASESSIQVATDGGKPSSSV